MWDIKYRPVRFDQVLGQEAASKVLRARLLKGSGFDTSYIFSGGAGNGKTTLARILARGLLCSNLVDGEPCGTCQNCVEIMDDACAGVTEMDAASKGTVASIRAYVDELAFQLPGIKKRILILDEAHRLSGAAQDALLKPVEDKKLVAIFCTTEPDKLLGPIHTRCESYHLRRIKIEDLVARAESVLRSEGAEYEPAAVELIVQQAGGKVRAILNQLEQLAQLGPVTLTSVRDYLQIGNSEILLNLFDAPTEQVATGLHRLLEEYDSADLAQSLASVLMNAHKSSLGLQVGFIRSEADLAARVATRLGPNLFRVVEKLLDTRSRVGLEVTVLGAFAPQVVVTPQVVVASQPTQAIQAPPPQPQAPAPVQAQPQSVVTAPFVPNVELKSHEKVISAKPFPRTTVGVKPTSQVRSNTQVEFLTPAEWRIEFLRVHFPQGRPTAS